jgi:hypothetical protein
MTQQTDARAEAVANLETALAIVLSAQPVAWESVWMPAWLLYAQLALQEALDAARSDG